MGVAKRCKIRVLSDKQSEDNKPPKWLTVLAIRPLLKVSNYPSMGDRTDLIRNKR